MMHTMFCSLYWSPVNGKKQKIKKCCIPPPTVFYKKKVDNYRNIKTRGLPAW